MKSNLEAYRIMNDIYRLLRQEVGSPTSTFREVVDLAIVKLRGRMEDKELSRLWHIVYLRQDMMNFETISRSQVEYLKAVRKALMKALKKQDDDNEICV
ncbi:hypothetical protein [Shouchella clausii]|jgi:hypothetical protein|uniref:Uncharacterized protein n=1 Tax=Shouchella clausii TaxID=79880 RepID=A0A268S230_SHOCL|nr:hypothetical protein [Shouchella clausii]PAD43424.1 hypothetical protein CHH54_07065 [Bacillus sp. 7520-S]SPT78641.1 Uncharacterised protein [Niallia circulans]AST96341.1 hypothetical protein BC8716_10450 [Shouchella clausii]MBU8596839.1 hypothetical protein [Shouchella clausii]MCM3550498.1 hypothetical protein [Shouchella clausii]